MTTWITPSRPGTWPMNLSTNRAMTICLLTAGMIAALSGATGMAVKAADLADSGAPYARTDTPYDDPRYSAIYGRKEIAKLPRRYDEPLSRPYERSYSYPRAGSGYDNGRLCDRPGRYAYKSRSYPTDGSRGFDQSRYSDRCLRKTVIRRRLRDDGWYGFELVRLRRDVAILKARKGDGDRYRIRVDRCSGEILRSRLLRRSFGRHDTFANNDWQRSRSF